MLGTGISSWGSEYVMSFAFDIVDCVVSYSIFDDFIIHIFQLLVLFLFLQVFSVHTSFLAVKS